MIFFLDDIYYPLTVEVASNKDKVVIKDGVTLPFHGIVNIVGIAGQGKSTILRKLFSEEIKKSERMPFFIELRRVKNANIIAYLADILNSFGVGCSEDSLKILLQSQGNDSNLLIVFYVQIMPDDFVMQLHR
ncbi:hypothetical protein OU605_08270, partial [Escherichia coli]|nr:hypothetical protein [Escherichia coli]MDF8768970.1 hypothetical protein [Escherichia coli]